MEPEGGEGQSRDMKVRHTSYAEGAVVVGVDESPAGRQALEWAADQAEREHRRLVLVRATGSLGTAGTTWLDSAEPSSTLRGIVTEATEVLASAVQRVSERHPSLEVQTHVATEDPAPELRRLTDQAHLVVVGSRGTKLLRHLPTWQVGARIAGRAGCPVVVVPAHNPQIVRQGVLVGADLSARSRPVLHFAYQCASEREQPLTVAHLVQSPRDHDSAERLMAEAVSGLREQFPDVHAHLRLIHGSPTARLLQMATRMHLLVVGQHHDLGTYESPLGHVHASVVDRSPCPVAVVPLGPDAQRGTAGAARALGQAARG